MFSDEPILSVKGVGKCFHIYEKPSHRLLQFFLPSRKVHRDFWALRDISFSVGKGKSVGILGRNGAGKSTLLEIICGTLTPTTGSVDLRGRVAALLELGAGFNPDFTGRENVYVCAAIYGMSREQIDARYDLIVNFADIGDFIDQPVKTYSSGMYVRLAFAVIAHVDADILIIDEALAVGDAIFTQKCMRFLREFKKHGVLFFVSHDITSVKSLCDQALWLADGNLMKFGTAKDVCASYLAHIYQSQEKREEPAPLLSVMPETDFFDARREWVNQSNLRNDIEIFRFSPEKSASFGIGGASISNVVLLNENGQALNWCVGGEMVTLKIDVQMHAALYSPIVGFTVQDRLGQPLFGDNTYLSYRDNPLSCDSGSRLSASFQFRMPVLMNGDYAVAVAVASGTQEQHVQHQWLNEALLFSSHSTSASTGLMGIPMKQIEISQD